MQVTVLAGGESDERDVSRVSGISVAAALRSAGHTVKLLDATLWPRPTVPLVERHVSTMRAVPAGR